jgi:hypothetical protein
LNGSEYIISPNLRYRFYYQNDGLALVIDTHNQYESQEGWEAICVLHPSHDNAPGWFIYGDSSPADPGNWVIRDSSWNTIVASDTVTNHWGAWGGPVGDHALIVSDGGTLMMVDELSPIHFPFCID